MYISTYTRGRGSDLVFTRRPAWKWVKRYSRKVSDKCILPRVPHLICQEIHSYNKRIYIRTLQLLSVPHSHGKHIIHWYAFLGTLVIHRYAWFCFIKGFLCSETNKSLFILGPSRRVTHKCHTCSFFPSYFTFFFWRELLRHVLHSIVYFVFVGSKQHRTAKFLYLYYLQCEEYWPVFNLRLEPNATYREYKETAHMRYSNYPIS